MNVMRLLITGATGFIGRNLIPHLLREGYEPTLLVREAYGMGTPLPPPLDKHRPNLQLVYADLRNFNLTVRALREARPDTIIHLAAQGATTPFLNPDTAVRHNLTGTLNLFRAAFDKTFTTQRLIMARTPGELDKINVYATSKAAAWGFGQMYTRTQNWPIVGAMIFQAYGPYQPQQAFIPAAIRMARAGENFPMTSGTQTRDFVHVADVARGLLATAVSPDLPPGTTLELGTGQATSLRTVAELIYELVAPPHGRVQPGTLPSRPGETPQPIANLSATKQLIAWQPHHTLRTGLHTLLTTNQK